MLNSSRSVPGADAGYASSAWRSIIKISSLSLLVAFSISCATQAKIVANSTSALIWYRHLYNRQCVDVKTKAPNPCKELFLRLEQLREDTTAASEAIKVGSLPASAVQSIKKQVAILETP